MLKLLCDKMPTVQTLILEFVLQRSIEASAVNKYTTSPVPSRITNKFLHTRTSQKVRGVLEYTKIILRDSTWFIWLILILEAGKKTFLKGWINICLQILTISCLQWHQSTPKDLWRQSSIIFFLSWELFFSHLVWKVCSTLLPSEPENCPFPVADPFVCSEWVLSSYLLLHQAPTPSCSFQLL